MPKFQVRDESRSLAFYDAESAASALTKFAEDEARAAAKLALSVAVSEMTVSGDEATTTIDGRRYYARPV